MPDDDEMVTCPHCGKQFSVRAMGQWKAYSLKTQCMKSHDDEAIEPRMRAPGEHVTMALSPEYERFLARIADSNPEYREHYNPDVIRSAHGPYGTR